MHTNRVLGAELSGFPHHALLEGATPIQHLRRLSALLGAAEIFVKRDDLNAIGGGGNKLRKLEFLMGEALAAGADTIITVGARQSNHARLTAATAARAGLACELVLTRSAQVPGDEFSRGGNVLLDGLFGARVHDVPPLADALVFAEQRASDLRALGHKVYVCPLGGSSPIGSLGYVGCAAEIAAQADDMGLAFDQVVVPNGSGGTHAGLAAGFALLGFDPASILGFTVLHGAERAHVDTHDKANRTARLLDRGICIESEGIAVDGSQLGRGYGIPTDAMLKAVRLLASTEGLLVDPVYGGKAFAGLLQAISEGRYRSGQHILFVMTGGLPGLFAYREVFQQLDT